MTERKQHYTGKLGARDYKTNQRELYIRRFNLRQTDRSFVVLYDGKEFLRVSKEHPVPATFAFKIACTAFLYCIGRRTLVWDELAALPMKDIEVMQTVPFGLKNVEPAWARHVKKPEAKQLDLEEILGHA